MPSAIAQNEWRPVQSPAKAARKSNAAAIVVR